MKNVGIFFLIILFIIYFITVMRMNNNSITVCDKEFEQWLISEKPEPYKIYYLTICGKKYRYYKSKGFMLDLIK